MAAIQEGVSGRYSSATFALGFRDAHQRSNRICSMPPSECRNIFVTFRPARRVAGLAGAKRPVCVLLAGGLQLVVVISPIAIRPK